MNSKLRIACAAVLTATALPALALQLGEIQVKSTLNQPLVAAIPLQPKNLTELDGLTVGLAPADDFARAGLQVTPTDQTLQFHVVTDNNGQKLILVTSSQPITDPYLDFLIQVNTREGKQVREFVVLLNPVIAAPAPAVQAAPVPSAPSANAAPAQPEELPPPSQFPQPQPPAPPPAAQPVPVPQHHAQPATPQAPPAQSPGQVEVKRGDTLYGIASDVAKNSGASVDQMMLALQAANPDAFFKDNINNLKAGAILRIPTRDIVDQRSAAAAAAEVHRQYESWRAAKPHPATVVEGTAAQAAANATPKPEHAPAASDHLTLAPPTSGAGGTHSRAGVAGGTGTATVTDLQQQLRANRDTLVSLNQSNADLESRVHSLKDISAKSDKLLSLKDATVAELQRKLAAVQSHAAAAAGSVNASAKSSASAPAVAKKPVTNPAAAAAAPWYMRPLAWAVAGVIVLLLIVLGLSGRRRRPALEGPSHGPLADPDDVAPRAAEPFTDEQEVIAERAPVETVPDEVHAQPAEPEPATEEDPYGLAALREPAAKAPPVEPSEAPVEPASVAAVTPAAAFATEDEYTDDPVDTKLDLARAYLDMGDPVGARAMLEEVLEEGSQSQKDEAKRLLADVEA